MNFMQSCVRGLVKISDFQKEVEAWLSDDDAALSLCEHLGITSQEYAAWIGDPGTLTQTYWKYKREYNQLNQAIKWA